MRKLILPFAILILLASCKDDSYLLTPPPIPDQSFSEEFESITSLKANGWDTINASSPKNRPQPSWLGPSITSYIPLFSGSGYAFSVNSVAQGAANYSLESTISNWIVSKPITIQNGDKIVFYTNSVTLDLTPTGLELRMNVKNDGTNVGDGEDPGDFTELISAVNATQKVNTFDSYPTSWTRFEATVSGLTSPVKGRIAFRYYVPYNFQYNAPTTIVAIDRMTYTSVVK